MTRAAVLACALAALAGCKTGGANNTSEVPANLRVAATPLDAGVALHFDFAPPASKTLTERSRVARAEAPAPGSQAPAHAEAVEASLESRYEPTADGWMLVQRIPSVVISRDGKVWDDPLVKLVTLFPIKVKLSAAGAFLSLVNPEDARDAVKKTFPRPEEQDALLGYFTSQALETQARREWNGKYADLLGRDLRAGTALYAVESVGLTTGQEVQYVMERTVTGTTASDYGEAVVFSVKCLAKAEDAVDGPALQKMLKDRGDVTPDPTAWCEGQQVVARAPFVPVKSWLSMRATPEPKPGGPKLEVKVEKVLFATKLE